MKKRDCPFVALNIDARSRTPRGAKPNRRLHNQHRGSAVCFRPQFIAWHPVASFAFSQKPIFSYVRSPTECHSFGGFVKTSVKLHRLKGSQRTYFFISFFNNNGHGRDNNFIISYKKKYITSSLKQRTVPSCPIFSAPLVRTNLDSFFFFIVCLFEWSHL